MDTILKKRQGALPSLLITLLIGLINGCARVPAIPTISETPSAKAIKTPKDIKSFTIKGIISVRDAKQGFTANYHWTQSSSNYFDVRFFGPMGAQATNIHKRGEKLTIKTANETAHSANGDDLIYKKTGYHLPINKLYFWLRGLSNQGMTLPATSTQAGWLLSYRDYQSVHQLHLPRKLFITRDDLKIKIIITSWRVRA